MDNRMARPIFVVGSPRSGTSILTWALGQHPNILVTEESDWIGPFAVQAAAHHATGSARGERSQLSALGIDRAELLHAFGATIDRQILHHRESLERRKHDSAQRNGDNASPEFAIARAAEEPKARWVDGTPEYSLHIAGLLALFPAAKFVHILRDADEVVASLLVFLQDDGTRLVADADEAYAYWLRRAAACVAAERALGAAIVHRVRHADLAADPEPALRGILEFLGEPFAPACLEPLRRRINSSFADESVPRARPQTSSKAIAQARELSARWLASGQAVTAEAEAKAQFDADFEERVRYALRLPSEYRAMQNVLEKLEVEMRAQGSGVASAAEALETKRAALKRTRRALTVSGVLLFALWLTTLAEWRWPDRIAASCSLAVATFGVLIYAWWRRAGLRAVWRRLLGKNETKAKEPQ
ncbi:MAG TPA: sulfotransferase [Rudaea sp.]|nr:sulfotransferase [Rudaea sp.]